MLWDRIMDALMYATAFIQSALFQAWPAIVYLAPVFAVSLLIRFVLNQVRKVSR